MFTTSMYLPLPPSCPLLFLFLLQEKIRAKLQERADKAREEINEQVGAHTEGLHTRLAPSAHAQGDSLSFFLPVHTEGTAAGL